MRGVEIGMVRRCLAYAVIAACSSSFATAALADSRAVIELFTSQGCSSCPPADKLLGELATDPSLIAISLSIDIWDYLGWRDTLADPLNTMRWQAYSKARGDRERYTPQAIVNGVAHTIGSDRGGIDKAIAKSRQNASVMSVPVTLEMRGNGRLGVSVPERSGAGGEILILGLSKAVTVAIPRGENKGRTITYHNVVRRWLKAEHWEGTAKSVSAAFDAQQRQDIDSVAVLLQGGSTDMPGALLGAAMASLR
jgi:hypothetical protein